MTGNPYPCYHNPSPLLAAAQFVTTEIAVITGDETTM